MSECNAITKLGQKCTKKASKGSKNAIYTNLKKIANVRDNSGEV